MRVVPQHIFPYCSVVRALSTSLAVMPQLPVLAVASNPPPPDTTGAMQGYRSHKGDALYRSRSCQNGRICFLNSNPNRKLETEPQHSIGLIRRHMSFEGRDHELWVKTGEINEVVESRRRLLCIRGVEALRGWKQGL